MDLRQIESTARLEKEKHYDIASANHEKCGKTLNQFQQQRRLNMRERPKKQRQQKNACNVARTVFLLSSVVPFVMGFERDGTKNRARPRWYKQLTPPRSE